MREKDGQRLSFDLYVRSESQENIQAARLVKEMTEPIGVEFKVQAVSADKLYDLTVREVDGKMAPDFDTFIWGWGGDPYDPGLLLNLLTTNAIGGSSDSFYSNPEYDQLYEQQSGEFDTDARKAIVEQMIALSQRDLPYLVLTVDPILQAYRTDRIAGVEQSCPKPDGDIICDQVAYAPWLELRAADRGGHDQLERRRRLERAAVRADRAGGARGRSRRLRRHPAAPGRPRGHRGVSPRWLAGKALAAFLTLIFVLVFNFFLFRVMGDPTSQLARLPRASPEEIQQLRAYYGLDKPLLGQFADYVGDTVRGDLGISQKTRRSVWTEIKEALPWTLLLVGVGTLLATVIGTWLGIVAATRRGTPNRRRAARLQPVHLRGARVLDRDHPDPAVRGRGADLPRRAAEDAGVGVHRASTSVLDIAEHLVLPATAMTLMLLGQYFVIMRSSMVDVLTEDFITVKRATGLPWARVVRSHAVPNALLPLVTLSAIQFGIVMGGAITIETIFSWPGLGLLNFDAINDKDFPVLQGTFLVFSVAVILANLLADCLYFFLDPRVQSA